MIGLPSGFVSLTHAAAAAEADFKAAVSRFPDFVTANTAAEHVGSTAIRGLVAKPIVDIAVGVFDLARFADIIHQFVAIGYRYRGHRRDAGGHILDYQNGILTTRHVHVVPFGGTQWQRYLLFRSYMQLCAAARAQYAEEKIRLAARYHRDRRAYTAQKSLIIDQLLAEAAAHPECLLRSSHSSSKLLQRLTIG